MPKIYLVTSGEHSSDTWDLRGVYSTRELAEKARSLFSADNIESHELDCIPEIPEGMIRFCVEMDENGDVRNVYPSSLDSVDDAVVDWRPCGTSAWVEFFVWAKDKEQAVEMTNQRRKQVLASGEWTTDIFEWFRRRDEQEQTYSSNNRKEQA